MSRKAKVIGANKNADVFRNNLGKGDDRCLDNPGVKYFLKLRDLIAALFSFSMLISMILSSIGMLGYFIIPEGVKISSALKYSVFGNQVIIEDRVIEYPLLPVSGSGIIKSDITGGAKFIVDHTLNDFIKFKLVGLDGSGLNNSDSLFNQEENAVSVVSFGRYVDRSYISYQIEKEISLHEVMGEIIVPNEVGRVFLASVDGAILFGKTRFYDFENISSLPISSLRSMLYGPLAFFNFLFGNDEGNYYFKSLLDGELKLMPGEKIVVLKKKDSVEVIISSRQKL